MGWAEDIFAFFNQQGVQAAGQVTAPQPVTSSGQTYGATTPGGITQPATQPQAPQPIQFNPVGAVTGFIGGMSNYVGQGVQNISSGFQQTFVQPVQNFIQPFQSISQTNPIQQIQMGVIGGIQNFTNPQQQIPVNATINSTNFNQTLPSLQGMTLFVPYGGQAQTQVNNLNAIVYDPVGGGFVGTTVPYGHSISNIVTSGSSGSLQSGMFSTKPLTPVVYTQESAGTVYSAAAVPAAAALVLASPASYSRMGAEAYGGYVAPLDARTIQSTGAQMGVYPSSSGNLANLVDPYGVNQPKSAWTEMPWNTPVMSTPGIYSLGTSGIMTPISTQGMASIGMAAPVMSAPLPGVGYTRGVGNEWNPFVASAAVPIGYISEGWQMSPKTPPSYIAPTGKIFGAYIPGVSNVLAFFQPGKIISTTESSMNLPEVTSLKGTTTENVPGGILTTQYFETTGGKTVTKTTTETPTKSGYDQFQGGISDWMYSGLGSAFGVSKEQARTSLSISGTISREMANYAPATNLPTAVGVAEIQKGFNEPVTAAVNVGIGIAFGAGFKALEGVYGISRAATAEKVISQGGLWRGAEVATSFAMEKFPLVLGGLYGFSVAERSTSGFQNFQPGNVATSFVPILTYETIPMGVGFGLPGQAITAARLSNIGYKSAVQEGVATGRFDYYVKQPVTRPYEMAKIDYASYIQEGGTGLAGYAGYKVESSYRLNVDIPIKTFIQEGFTRPVPEPISPAPINNIPQTGVQPTSRMGTKIVGGKEVSSLAPERSLQSAGSIGKQTLESSGGKGFASSRTVDFRGTQSQTMKPMTRESLGFQESKQATGQMQIFSEPLPKIEGLTQGKIIPQQQAQRSFMASPFAVPTTTTGLISVIEPELLFSQTSEIRQQQSQQQEPVLGRITFGSSLPASGTKIASEIMTGQKQSQVLSQFNIVASQSAQQTQQAVRETVRSRDILYGLDIARVTDIVPRSDQRNAQRVTPFSEVGLRSDIIQRSSQIVTPTQITTYKPWEWKIPVPTITPFPALFPGVPGSGGGGGGRKRRGAFIETFGMGLDYSLKRPPQRQGKSWAQPKKVQKARAAAKKGGKKK